jgi:organic radical activating enzyme
MVTQFVRFAGCNLKCPGWPCDSQFAIDPKLFRKEQQLLTPADMANRIRGKMLDTGATNVCFTGGEPFLQVESDLLNLLDELDGEEFKYEVFTNGTMPIHEDFFDFDVHPVVDWKLPGSGEADYSQTRMDNVGMMTDYEKGCVKFTIAGEVDFRVARTVWSTYLRNTNLEVFAGAVWNKLDTRTLVGWIQDKRLPWRLNVQVHNYIYGAQTRGT